MSAGPYVHLATPVILLFPLITLLPAPPSPPPDLPGIIPVTIRRVTPRRSVILTALSLLAFSSFLDGALLVADLLTASSRDGHLYLVSGELGLVSWIFYSVGGLVIWSVAAIAAEYRTKWGDRGVVALATLGFVCEVPNLVLLIIGVVHAVGKWRVLSILAIVPSAFRLLVLPVLLVAASTPKISYERADETSALLSGENAATEEDAPGPSSSTANREAYGTFANSPTTANATSTAVPSGANTPAINKGPVKIPKQLGEIKKEDKDLEWREVWGRLKQLSPYLWPSTSRKLQLHVILCTLLLAAGRVLQPMLPLSLGGVVHALTNSQHGSKTSPWIPFISYFAIRLTVSGAGLLYFIEQRLWVPVAQYTDREMMLLCFNHLLNLSLAYHTKRNTGEVLKVIDRGSAINNLFQTVLFTAVPTLFDMAIAFFVFFYLYGGVLAGMTFVVMTLYLYVSVTATQARIVTRRQLRDKDIKQRGIISDVLTNWESVKYFTAETREVTRFREALVSYQETEAKWNKDYQLLYLAQSFLLALGALSGSLLISYRVLRGDADAADFVIFIQYYQQLSSPLDRLGYLYQSLNRTSVDAEKMFALLAEATEVNDKPGAKDLIVTDGVVEFDNVSFSYDGQVKALDGVSFKIGKGQSMALVGESGSGKSTILRLLYRFYDIESGVIRIDGQDISQVTQHSLRKAIGIVPQDSVLWNDTIGANISYGKEGATDEDIVEAARAARLHDRILSFADDYSTIVGERGIRLSGGEKQRVSLARMFLKSPAILVLDEATSALDTETEREIQRALTDLSKGRSSLSIAHRLSTIINSDQIVVMRGGKVVEAGSYSELLELDGVFASMWNKQIHTEAEMMAAAGEGSGTSQLITFNAEPEDPESKPEREAAESHEPEDKSAGDKLEHDRPAHQHDKTEHAPSASATGYQVDKSTASGDSTDPSLPKDTKATEEDVETAADDATPSFADVVKAGTTSEPETQVTSDRPAPITEESPSGSGARETPSATVPEPASLGAPVSTPREKPAAQVSQEAVDIEDKKDNQDTGESQDTTKQAEESTKDKAVPFPGLSARPSSRSIHSQTSGSGAGSPSTPNALLAPGATEDDSGRQGKARKRLSSIKGFVRRISDQGMTRSPSWSSGKGKNPLDADDTGSGSPTLAPTTIDEANSTASNLSEESKADKKKKNRLSKILP